MNGSVKQSDTEQQTKTDLQNAGRAEHVTMLGISRQDILRHGGIWPPDGTTERTEPATSCRSALPAICTTKDGNGISVDDLTKLSAVELKRLCELRNARDRMEWRNSGNSLTVTKSKRTPSWQQSLPSLTDQQREKLIHELREERRKLLHKVKTDSYDYLKLRKIGMQLYAVTGYLPYINAMDNINANDT